MSASALEVHSTVVVTLPALVPSFPDGQSPIPVFDKTLQVKQMHVLEKLDLLITRTDKGKEPDVV